MCGINIIISHFHFRFIATLSFCYSGVDVNVKKLYFHEFVNAKLSLFHLHYLLTSSVPLLSDTLGST